MALEETGDMQMRDQGNGPASSFEETFPKIRLQRDVAFVESGKFSSASAGIAGVDLALHIISGYQGDGATEAVAQFLGHRSDAWRNQ